MLPLSLRFAQPGRAWGQQIDHLYPAYDFPFTYAPQTDPLTGRTQGLLDRCTATDTCPRIVHAATALEVWEGRQSLGLTDPLGQRDAPEPPGVRTYIMVSTQHGAASLPLPAKAPFGACEQQPNPNPHTWTMRALLDGLTAWVRDGREPPASAVPRVADGTLVAPDAVRFPTIPANAYGGVERPALRYIGAANPLHVLDYGPEYRPGDIGGVITVEPPRIGTAGYGVLVPQVDADGNDLGGVRSLDERVPDRDLHGLEPVPRGLVRGRLLQPHRQLRPLRPHPVGTGRDGRPAALAGGALPRQGGLRRRGQAGRGRAGRATLPAAGGRGPAGGRGRAGRGPLGAVTLTT